MSADVSLGLLQGYPAHLVERGWDVHVVSSPGRRLAELGGEPGVTVHALAMERDPSPLRDLVSLLRWVGLLWRLRPDTVYVGTPKAGLLGTLAAVLVGVAHRVYILRGLRFETTQGLTRQLLVILERLTAAGAHVVVAVSPSLRDRALESGIGTDEKVRVLGRGSSNGVDTTHFDRGRVSEEQRRRLAADLGLDPDRPVVGFVGRLGADKGLHDLAAAHHQLEDDGVPHQLLVVGPVEDGGAALRAFGDRPDALVRTGAVPDTAPYYALMDVLVLPTRREGFPNVVLEASASSVPVITTDATGAVDSVVDGQTGQIVPVGDPAALADAVATLLADPAAGRRMGRQGRELVLASFERTRFWDYVDELLEGPPPPSEATRVSTSSQAATNRSMP
ncbi:glycosyltransferase family 4 protein [uncultured Friedmanniella sp.]|uniref:glycosyltransferase family 4 protein n=1 Tax=uncultured Friedmanniella sp. TaxID=335381 RepID=UPI0035CC079A